MAKARKPGMPTRLTRCAKRNYFVQGWFAFAGGPPRSRREKWISLGGRLHSQHDIDELIAWLTKAKAWM